MNAMSPSQDIAAIQKNIIKSAHSAIGNWGAFPWHRSGNKIDTCVEKSSQALAIDLFGTIKTSSKKNLVMDAFAGKNGLPTGGEWKINLEWMDDENKMLHESRRSQIDAMATNGKAFIFFECKFTEREAGTCSQPLPIKSGAHEGMIQCNGNYEYQQNPVNGKESRCALSAKNIRYWDFIPEIFAFDSKTDYRPCPFRDSWYQWMRNLVLCCALAEKDETKLVPAFFVVYADSDHFEMTNNIKSEDWKRLISSIRKERIKFGSISYQEFSSDAISVTNQDATFIALQKWIDDKIKRVEAEMLKTKKQFQ